MPVTACANRHLKFIDSEVSHSPVGPVTQTDSHGWKEGNFAVTYGDFKFLTFL